MKSRKSLSFALRLERIPPASSLEQDSVNGKQVIKGPTGAAYVAAGIIVQIAVRAAGSSIIVIFFFSVCFGSCLLSKVQWPIDMNLSRRPTR